MLSEENNSLTLIYITVVDNFNEFLSVTNTLPLGSGLEALASVLRARQSLAVQDNNPLTLASQRDAFRRTLKELGLTSIKDGFEPLTSWLNDLLGHDKSDSSVHMRAYFQLLLIDIHKCSGHPRIGGQHIELTDRPRRKAILTLDSFMHLEYNGNFGHFMADFFSGMRQWIPAQSCWRTKEGQPLCTGSRQDIRGLPISVPISLRIEIQHEGFIPANDQVWDFPLTVFTSPDGIAEGDGIAYDLVGFALFNPVQSHFITRYVHHNKVITYDGMKYDGYSIMEPGATVETHLAGRSPSLPDGYTVHQVFYRLQGGLVAQEKFYTLRSAYYKDQFNISVSRNSSNDPIAVAYQKGGMIEMDKRDRFWMIDGPRRPTTEYLTQNAPISPDTSIIDDNSLESEDETLPPNYYVAQISQRGSPESLPDSLFSLNCRCGLVGDGNKLYQTIEGEAIQCNECNDWSHIACQTDGRASGLKKDEKFFCDMCL
ncbi:hypothetical protein BDZ94DRAFT_1327669, partial [Collybia nuda]